MGAIRKDHEAHEIAEKARPQLRVVRGGETQRIDPPQNEQPIGAPTSQPPVPTLESTREISIRITAIYFLGFLATLGGLFLFTATPGEVVPVELKSFYSLHDVYKANGIDAYLTEKQALRVAVQKWLTQKTDGEATRAATNIAVYLFPDLLDDENLEKQVALESWARLMEAIERAPQATESRLWFEELRANVWNYEIADRAAPKLTSHGKQALQIYEVLSAQ